MACMSLGNLQRTCVPCFLQGERCTYPPQPQPPMAPYGCIPDFPPPHQLPHTRIDPTWDNHAILVPALSGQLGRTPVFPPSWISQDPHFTPLQPHTVHASSGQLAEPTVGQYYSAESMNTMPGPSRSRHHADVNCGGNIRYTQ